MAAHYTIYTKADGVELFAVERGGCIVRLFATCDNCGCDVLRGQMPDESDRALRERLGGKRAALRNGKVPCANCGKEYTAMREKE